MTLNFKEQLVLAVTQGLVARQPNPACAELVWAIAEAIHAQATRRPGFKCEWCDSYTKMAEQGIKSPPCELHRP